jgi:hypothetical protein
MRKKIRKRSKEGHVAGPRQSATDYLLSRMTNLLLDGLEAHLHPQMMPQTKRPVQHEIIEISSDEESVEEDDDDDDILHAFQHAGYVNFDHHSLDHPQHDMINSNRQQYPTKHSQSLKKQKFVHFPDFEYSEPELSGLEFPDLPKEEIPRVLPYQRTIVQSPSQYAGTHIHPNALQRIQNNVKQNTSSIIPKTVDSSHPSTDPYLTTSDLHPSIINGTRKQASGQNPNMAPYYHDQDLNVLMYCE